MADLRNAVIVGSNRIPFGKVGGAYASATNIDMLTAALDGLAARFGLAGERLGEVGAGAVLKLIDRWPVIVWAGAALLGWVAGEMIATDPWVAAWLDRHGDPPDIAAAILGAVVVLAIAGAIKLARRNKRAR